MRNKKIRVSNKIIEYMLNESHEDFETDEIYEKAMEVFLLMGIFEDVYPGIVISQSKLSGNYLVKFYTGFGAFFEPQDLITQD